jgi:hypothetical protein
MGLVQYHERIYGSVHCVSEVWWTLPQLPSAYNDRLVSNTTCMYEDIILSSLYHLSLEAAILRYKT